MESDEIRKTSCKVRKHFVATQKIKSNSDMENVCGRKKLFFLAIVVDMQGSSG